MGCICIYEFIGLRGQIKLVSLRKIFWMPHDGDDFVKPPPDPVLRVKVLESPLIEKGLVDPTAMDALIDQYETKVGPRNGARVVAKAWVDGSFLEKIKIDCSAEIFDVFGFQGRQGEHIIAVENTSNVHNVVVCTLCSCYPWTVLGLPPVWYKSAPYRSRVVEDPRGVLREFGTEIPEDREIRIWDSTSEMRYLVIPERPIGTDGWSEEQLSQLVTRDSMIGVGLVKNPVDFAVS